MQFKTFTLDLTLFLSLITVLTSLPTESFFYSLQTRPGPYSLTQRSVNPRALRRNDGGIDGRIFPKNEPRNTPQGSDEIHNTRYQDRNRPPHKSQPVIPDQPDFEQADQPARGQTYEPFYSVTGEEFLRTEDDESGFTTTDVYGVQNFSSTYSSHITCEEENSSKGSKDKISVVSDDGREGMVGSGRSNNEMQKINFEENSRNYRRGNTKKDGTNTISTTEKNPRHPIHKGGSGSKRQRPSSTKPQNGQIVFPDGYLRQKFTPRGSKCGKKTTFCEHVGEDYPSDYINQILKKEGAMFREFFGKDVISDPNITERIHAPEENSLCPFRQEVVFPRAAKNKEDKWLFVINQDQYVQGVTVEVCLNPESRCILTEGFPLGYTPYCKQKYIERRLVAIGEDGKPHSDSFRLPSCCSCVVKHETSARMGSLRTTRNTSPAVKAKPSKNS